MRSYTRFHSATILFIPNTCRYAFVPTVIPNPPLNGDDGGSQTGGKWLPLADIEQKYVERVLAYTKGNKQAASRILNIDRKTLARIVARGPSGE